MDSVAVVSDRAVISREESLRRMLDLVAPLEPEEVPIPTCLGQVLAEDVSSELDVPPWNCAARDGYALRAADTAVAGPERPVELRIVGESYAGARPRRALPPDAAVRVMTGAPLPEGADCVVPLEYTGEDETANPAWSASAGSAFLRLTCPLRAGCNVRRVGTDLAAGGRALRRGTLLRPPHIAVLAALGRHKVRVIRRPVVALLATGDELVEPADCPAPGQLYNSNGYAVGAQVLHYGGIPTLLGVVPDDRQVLRARLREGLIADLLVTTGGTSRGKRDLVGQVLRGQEHVSLWGLAVQGGKPVAFRVLHDRVSGRRVPHLALPGNPMSAIVAFEIFGRPLLLKQQGRTDLEPQMVMAIAQQELANPHGRPRYVPVKLTKGTSSIGARLARLPKANTLVALAEADGLAIVPPGVGHVRVGERVTVMLPGWGPIGNRYSSNSAHGNAEM